MHLINYVFQNKKIGEPTNQKHKIAFSNTYQGLGAIIKK